MVCFIKFPCGTNPKFFWPPKSSGGMGAQLKLYENGLKSQKVTQTTRTQEVVRSWAW